MEVRSTSVQVEVHAPICAAAAEMLTPDALRFVGFPMSQVRRPSPGALGGPDVSQHGIRFRWSAALRHPRWQAGR